MPGRLQDALQVLVAPEVKRARFGTMLQRLMGTDTTSPTPIIHPAVTPIMPLDTLTQEHQFLRQVSLSSGGMKVAANAANNSVAYLRAVAAGMIVCLDELWLSSSASQQFYLFIGTHGNGAILMTPPNGEDFLDSRNTGTPTAVITGDNTFAVTTGLGTCIGTGIIQVNQLVRVPLQVSLTVGNTIAVFGNTVNTDLYATFVWRERSLPDVELGNG